MENKERMCTIAPGEDHRIDKPKVCARKKYHLDQLVRVDY